MTVTLADSYTIIQEGDTLEITIGENTIVIQLATAPVLAKDIADMAHIATSNLRRQEAMRAA
jgi:hypothetical protein